MFLTLAFAVPGEEALWACVNAATLKQAGRRRTGGAVCFRRAGAAQTGRMAIWKRMEGFIFTTRTIKTEKPNAELQQGTNRR